MVNPLKIAPPPPRRSAVEAVPDSAPAPEPAPVVEAAAAAPQVSAPMAAPKPAPKVRPAGKFRQVKEDERVQFNKRVTRRVADGFEMLAIRSRVKVPELLAEALELLEERYGRI
jgi:hypothetical protein